MNRSTHKLTLRRTTLLAVAAAIALAAFLASGTSALASPVIQGQRGASYDMKNNKLLYEKIGNPIAAAMASTTKTMTLAVTLDALNYNKVELTDTLQISLHA